MELAYSLPAYEVPEITVSEELPINRGGIVIYFIVAIVVLIALAITIIAGASLFCISQGLRFSGEFQPWTTGYVRIGCV